jgi:hypothetical protein
MSDVYNTVAAMNTVRIIPGTRPRIEYDQGKDMIARQIYSEKRSAAVYMEDSVQKARVCVIWAAH